MLLLALIHCGLGALWFAALIAAGRPLGQMLRQPALLRALDRITGGVFLAFGIKLALDDR
jgi:threonine/homoserine/homoserine lactone efflux protein